MVRVCHRADHAENFLCRFNIVNASVPERRAIRGFRGEGVIMRNINTLIILAIVTRSIDESQQGLAIARAG